MVNNCTWSHGCTQRLYFRKYEQTNLILKKIVLFITIELYHFCEVHIIGICFSQIQLLFLINLLTLRQSGVEWPWLMESIQEGYLRLYNIFHRFILEVFLIQARELHTILRKTTTL